MSRPASSSRARFFSRKRVMVLLAIVVVIATVAIVFGRSIVQRVMTSKGMVSAELADAPSGRTMDDRIAGWLRARRIQIRAVADRYRVSATTVAGVIAFEALEDPIPKEALPFSHFSGPGKVHYRSDRLGEGDPIARQIEVAGYLPRRSEAERQVLLATDDGAFEYIGAILDALANVAAHEGRNIRCNDAILSTFYSGWDIPETRHFFTTTRSDPNPNDAGRWVVTRKAWLESAVGDRPCTYKRQLYIPKAKRLTVQIHSS